MSQTNGWTEERRKRQSELIKNSKPWQKSTGPTSPVGLARSSKIAYKDGIRPMIRQLARLLREQEDAMEHL